VFLRHIYRVVNLYALGCLRIVRAYGRMKQSMRIFYNFDKTHFNEMNAKWKIYQVTRNQNCTWDDRKSIFYGRIAPSKFGA